MKFLLLLILALQVAPGFAQKREPVVVVTSYEFIQSTGCWVTLYEDRDFKGESLTLFNGLDIPKMHFSDTTDWTKRIESIAVGPKAQVSLFGKENFQDNEQVVKEGRKLAGFVHLPWTHVESLKLKCL